VVARCAREACWAGCRAGFAHPDGLGLADCGMMNEDG
jgi:hypothetical protein